MTVGAAHGLVGLAGLVLALSLWAMLRQRFLTRDEQHGRSFAMISAAIATIASAGTAVVLLAQGKHVIATLEPLVVAAPTGASAYALTALVIDALAAKQVGKRRRQIGFFALYAAVTLPLVMGFAAVSITTKIVIAIIVVGSLLAM